MDTWFKTLIAPQVKIISEQGAIAASSASTNYAKRKARHAVKEAERAILIAVEQRYHAEIMQGISKIVIGENPC